MLYVRKCNQKTIEEITQIRVPHLKHNHKALEHVDITLPIINPLLSLAIPPAEDPRNTAKHLVPVNVISYRFFLSHIQFKSVITRPIREKCKDLTCSLCRRMMFAGLCAVALLKCESYELSVTFINGVNDSFANTEKKNKIMR